MENYTHHRLRLKKKRKRQQQIKFPFLENKI